MDFARFFKVSSWSQSDKTWKILWILLHSIGCRRHPKLYAIKIVKLLNTICTGLGLHRDHMLFITIAEIVGVVSFMQVISVICKVKISLQITFYILLYSEVLQLYKANVNMHLCDLDRNGQFLFSWAHFFCFWLRMKAALECIENLFLSWASKTILTRNVWHQKKRGGERMRVSDYLINRKNNQ